MISPFSSLVLALTACFLFDFGASSCDNPLGEAHLVSLTNSEASRTGTCAEEILGGKSCCTQDYHNSAEDLLSELNDKYKANAAYNVAMVEAIDDVLDQIYERILQKLEDLGSDVDGLSGPERNDEDVDAELETITSKEWRDLVSSYPEIMQTCHQKLFDLGSVLQCLGCDPNWSSYMTTTSSSLEIVLSDSNCRELIDSCSDGDEIFYYFYYKMAFGLYCISVIEKLRGYYVSNDVLDDVYVDYYVDYTGEDDWETGDLAYSYAQFKGCSFGGYNSDFVSYQIGIFGPSVFSLMLTPNNYYNYVEELLAYGKGESNIFENRRLLEKNQSRRKERKLELEKYFEISFDTSSEFKDAFEIAQTLGISPTVKKLFGRMLALGLLTLICHLIFVF